MPQLQKLQFQLKYLLLAITILSALIGTGIYLHQPHLIEDGRYQITVDYSRTLEEIIAAGTYDYVNSDINATHFPLDPAKSGTETLEAVIVYLDKYVEDTEILLKLLAKKGFRPATFPELLAFGEQYPDLQRQSLIFVLGSRSQLDGMWSFQCLTGCDGRRQLRLRFWVGHWSGFDRFLAFRKPR